MKNKSYIYIEDSDLTIKKLINNEVFLEIHRDVFDKSEDEYIKLLLKDVMYINCPTFVGLGDFTYGDSSLLPSSFDNLKEEYFNKNFIVAKITDREEMNFFIVCESVKEIS